MSKEELLMPRYEVIADYPNSPFKIGQIIYPTKAGNDGFIDMMYIKIESLLSANWGNPAKYPHLFKPLPWYTHRAVEDMPEYIKVRNSSFNCISKIDEWITDREGDHWCVFMDKKKKGAQAFGWDCEPATLAEYEAFNSLKK